MARTEEGHRRGLLGTWAKVANAACSSSRAPESSCFQSCSLGIPRPAGQRTALCDVTGAVCSLALGFLENKTACGDRLARRPRPRPRLHPALPPFAFQIPSSRCPSW